tara:strand:- start:39 stop:311 length:273 start_codon:yes stop_codon:yes gene_type:complete
MKHKFEISQSEMFSVVTDLEDIYRVVGSVNFELISDSGRYYMIINRHRGASDSVWGDYSYGEGFADIIEDLGYTVTNYNYSDSAVTFEMY